MASYRIFGLDLESDLALLDHPSPGPASPGLTFTCAASRQAPDAWRQDAPVYESPFRTGGGESRLRLYRLPDGYLLHFPGVADFDVGHDRIACRRQPGVHDRRIVVSLLGTVLSFWLEWRGLPTLHASAVAIDGRTVGFLSTQGSGKSTLAGALMRAGHPLVTDDILPVERGPREHGSVGFVGRPGYPQMRFWPDQALHLLGHYADLELVEPDSPKRRIAVGPTGFGTFLDATQPIACLYLPERHEPGEGGAVGAVAPDMTPIRGREAVIALVRHSFAARAVQALGWQPRRLRFFADLAQQVPLRRLSYPSGFQHLPRVGQAILRDLGGLTAADPEPSSTA